jgi:hypothetical protein
MSKQKAPPPQEDAREWLFFDIDDRDDPIKNQRGASANQTTGNEANPWPRDGA